MIRHIGKYLSLNAMLWSMTAAERQLLWDRCEFVKRQPKRKGRK